jgi:hypothetical protein
MSDMTVGPVDAFHPSSVATAVRARPSAPRTTSSARSPRREP